MIKMRDLLKESQIKKIMSEGYAVILDDGADDFSIDEISSIFKNLGYLIKFYGSNSFTAMKKIKDVFLRASFNIDREAIYSLEWNVDNRKDRVVNVTYSPVLKPLNSKIRNYNIGNKFSGQDDLFNRMTREKIARVLKSKIHQVEMVVNLNSEE